ncbi:MAG: hypothetical protein K8T25_12480 [Planctomycetia bacterium]|nr:hypothetical protein [Planctomycetia bacterium]
MPDEVLARRWWHAALAALVVGGSLLLANVYGFKTDPLPDGSRFFIHGWPRGFLAHPALHFDPASLTSVEVSPWYLPLYDLESFMFLFPEGLLIDGLVAIILLTCTVLATMYGGQRPRFPFQLSLRQ